MLRRSFLGLALCLAAPGVIADSTPQIPVEAFFSFPKIAAVKISPDGKYLALVVADPKSGEDRKALAIVTTDGEHKGTASFKVAGYQIINDFWWTLDDRILVSTATLDTGIFDPPVWDGQLFGINADGTKQASLIPCSGGVTTMDKGQLLGGTAHDENRVCFGGPISMLTDDPRHVFVYGITYGLNHGYHWVAQAYSLDTYTGGLRLILQSPLQEGGFITDNQQLIRLATGEDAKTGDRKLLYRDNGDSHDWKDLSAALGGDDPAAPENGPAGMMGDDKTLYWFGRTSTSSVGLYSLDTDTLKLQELYSDPDMDVTNLVWSFDWIKPRKIIAVETMPGVPQVHILEPDDPKAGYLASLYQAFEGQHVEITSNTTDGTMMVVRASSDKNPGDYYLFNGKTGQASFMFSAKPEIDPKTMADMKPIAFQSRDGLTIHGYLTLPPGSNGSNLPLIINPHGGPHGIRDEWRWNPEAQFFASRGYAVLQVNYRGSGGYGMKFQDLGYGHWATSMQDDLADAVDWAVKQHIADPGRICIYGASYGGYAALENAERYPNLYKCIVGYVGLYDLATMDDSDFSHYAFGKHYTGVAVGRNDILLKTESPVNGADKVNAPVFIIYGGMDRRVVPANAEEMMAALDKAGKKYQKLYEPLEVHGFYKPEHRVELYTQMAQFFDKYIGRSAAQSVPAKP